MTLSFIDDNAFEEFKPFEDKSEDHDQKLLLDLETRVH